MSAAGGAAAGAFKVNSLTGLDAASAVEGKVVWDAPRSLWNGFMLGGALILGPLTFSWSAFAVFLATAAITLCAGHSVGFHRRLIHRSFECPKWLDYVMMWLGTAVGIGGPIWTIRLHDSRDWAQRQPDCHWFLRHARRASARRLLLSPLQASPGPAARLRPRAGHRRRSLLPLPRADLDAAAAARSPPCSILPAAGRGWSGACSCRVAACTTMHWFISYFAHTRGPSDWTVDGAVIQAYNVPVMAIPTMGESWHGNHHAFPSSARHGLYPGQIDLGYRFIQCLQLLGLAWNVKLPARLPPRPGITPTTTRALSIAAPGQAEMCGRAQG